MADTYGSNNTDSPDKMRAYAESVFLSFAAFRARLESTYKSTRLQYKQPNKVAGLDIEPAPTARALATVMQFVALADANPKAKVLPKDNTETEDAKTDKIEQFLRGVPRAISYFGMHPYDQYLHNFAEGGIGALLLDIDEGKAMQGKFPFIISAPSPKSIAYEFNKTDLLCCVVKESQQVGGLYQDLKTRWESSEEYNDPNDKEPTQTGWTIPPDLKEKAMSNPMDMIDCTYLYTPEKQYFWVQDARVWERKNWLGVVPLSIGLCLPLPSTKPEEYGFGLVYPALQMIQNEEMMLGKAYTGYSFYTFPMATFEYDDHVEIHQVKPVMQQTQDVRKITPLQAQPNYQSMEMLAQQANVAIGRVSLENISFGETGAGGNVRSGYLMGLLQDAPKKRVEKQIGYAADGIAKHYSMMLRAIELLATKEMAKALGAKTDEDVREYMTAFSTVAHPADNPDKKSLSRMVLSKADVAGYTEVEVDLMPEQAQDESAKYNRAKLARDVGMSNEGVFRNVLEVAEPDKEFAWQREDMLKQDPMWQEFLLRKAQQDLLNKDEKLAQEFILFKQAKDAAMAAQQQGGTAEAQGKTPLTQDQLGQIGAQAVQPNEQMNPQGGLNPDMAGLPPQMMPPSVGGQVPTMPNGGGM